MCIIFAHVGVDATQIRCCIARFRYALIRRGHIFTGRQCQIRSMRYMQ